MKKRNTTTIVLSKSTRHRLGQLGTKNETFDKIVQKLIDLYEKHHED